MSTYADAEDQYVEVRGIRFAYRRFGAPSGVPLVMLIHFRGTMDHWDPALIDPLAAARPIFIMDNSGIGRSGGAVVGTFTDWAQNTIDVLGALQIRQVDLLGFSMGGCAAQVVALNAPSLVRRLILCGTIPSTGDAVHQPDIGGPFVQLRSAVTPEEQKNAFLDTFFAPSETSRADGLQAWERINSNRKDRVDYLDIEGGNQQAVVFSNFMDPKRGSEGSYDRLHEIRTPVLVANGQNDVLLPTDNSFLLWKKLVNADPHLHLFPDSGHGFLYQYADQFSRLINEFLDTAAARDSRL